VVKSNFYLLKIKGGDKMKKFLKTYLILLISIFITFSAGCSNKEASPTESHNSVKTSQSNNKTQKLKEETIKEVAKIEKNTEKNEKEKEDTFTMIIAKELKGYTDKESEIIDEIEVKVSENKNTMT